VKMEPEGSGSSNSGAVEPKGRMRVEGVSAMGIELARIWAGASEEVGKMGVVMGWGLEGGIEVWKLCWQGVRDRVKSGAHETNLPFSVGGCCLGFIAIECC
jgi:hypothetical protein